MRKPAKQFSGVWVWPEEGTTAKFSHTEKTPMPISGMNLSTGGVNGDDLFVKYKYKGVTNFRGSLPVFYRVLQNHLSLLSYVSERFLNPRPHRPQRGKGGGTGLFVS